MAAKSIRCSRLPLISRCSAAAVEVAPVVSPYDESGPLGTALHHLQAFAVQGRHLEAVTVARMYDVDPDELGHLAGNAWRIWERMREWFPNPEVEVHMSAGLPESFSPSDLWTELSGHADVLAIVNDQVRVGDWKTGRSDEDVSAQLKGYGWLALQEHLQCQSVYSCVFRVRDQMTEGDVFSREELDQWVQGLRQQVERGEVFSPGGHCTYCPRGATCPGKTALMVQTYRVLAHAADGILEVPAAPEHLGQFCANLVEGARLLEVISETARGLAKAVVANHGGKLPTTDGRELVLVDQEQRRIDYRSGWGVLLASGADARDLMEAIAISKSKVEKLVMAAAPKGQKGTALREMYETLERAGAIRTNTITRLEIKRNGNGNAITAIGTDADDTAGSGDSSGRLAANQGDAPGSGVHALHESGEDQAHAGDGAPIPVQPHQER